MTEQTKALRLADALEAYWGADLGHDRERQAAAELRRLHGLDFALRDCELALQKMATKYMDAVDQRNALLEALRECLPYVDQMLANTGSMDAYYTEAKACAAIAKAEGEKV